jgi:hypothetical protein
MHGPELTCQKCKYFDEATNSCRKYAPRSVPKDSNPWPTVKSEDWCGEFVKAPNFNIQQVTRERMREMDKKYEKFESL